MTSVAATQSSPRLQHLPLPLFAAPMGLGGLGLAWREAGNVLHLPALIGEIFMASAAIVWLLLAASHLLRAARHPQALGEDLRHPIRSAFAAAVTVGLMILSGGLSPHAPEAARMLWLTAVTLHLGIAVWIVRGLLSKPRDAGSLLPPLLIPLVGNILAPAFGAGMGYETLCWMLFGIGALLWIAIQPAMLSRIISGPPIPERMRPALAILVAPPAAGSLSLAALLGDFGPASAALLGFALLIAAALLSMARALFAVPFSVAWWAWTFPSAAMTVAALKAGHAHPTSWTGFALGTLLVAITILILTIAAMTLRAMLSGALFQPEPALPAKAMDHTP